MAVGVRDPLGSGKITRSDKDSDGFYALRIFRKPDTDDGNVTGRRHLGIDWNADRDADEKAYATYDNGSVAYVSANAGGDRGGVVMLNHTLPDGTKFTTVYMHIENIPTKILNGIQKTVMRGELLGDSGFVKTGQALHVHYEVREGHQKGLAGVGYGYHDGKPGQGTLQSSGVWKGIDYADIKNPDGTTVRYYDPIAFTEAFRTVSSGSSGGGNSSRADLTVQNAHVDDTSVRVGDKVEVSWEIKNVGAADAAKSVAGVYLSRDATWDNSDLRVGDDSTTSLGRGKVDNAENDDFVVPKGLSGQWYVLVVADDKRAVTEGSESNNVWSQRITISEGKRPDLVIQNADINDDRVSPGQKVRVEWDAKNLGGAEAAKSDTHVYLSRDKVLSGSDRFLDDNALGTMKVGAKDSEYASVKIPLGVSPGGYYIGIVADAGDDVTEMNESNNIAWVHVDII
jgi:hypothetical protein